MIQTTTKFIKSIIKLNTHFYTIYYLIINNILHTDILNAIIVNNTIYSTINLVK